MAEKTDIMEESKSEEEFTGEAVKTKALQEKEDLIKTIEAMDASVLPNKDEILNKIKSEAGKKSDKETSKSKGNSFLLPIGLFFQFIFTVIGGGMFISGLIAGFSVKWDTTLDDGVANISIVLAIAGGILFAVGIALAFILYKAALKRYISSKLK